MTIRTAAARPPQAVPSRRPSKYLRTLLHIVITRGGSLRHYLRHRRDLLELREKDPRLLADIGITQADIDRALRHFRFWI